MRHYAILLTIIQCGHIKKMAITNVFVTVGTTKFDKLIDTLSSPELLKILKNKHCKKLVLQIGHGKSPVIEDNFGMDIEIFRIKESIENEILNADLIIGHAGAGTCLQSLQAGKRLIVVVNEDLMGNHQMELASRLSEEGYIRVAFCSDIEEILESELNVRDFKRYPEGQTRKYVEFIDKMLGFDVSK